MIIQHLSSGGPKAGGMRFKCTGVGGYEVQMRWAGKGWQPATDLCMVTSLNDAVVLCCHIIREVATFQTGFIWASTGKLFWEMHMATPQSSPVESAWGVQVLPLPRIVPAFASGIEVFGQL